jgi:DNA-binding transcriptional ArsR family regulator
MMAAGGIKWLRSNAMSQQRRKGQSSHAVVRSSAPIFAALGDEIRLRIVGRLSAGGPTSIARLTVGTGITRQAVTKHLHVLGDAGLVRGVHVGRESVWELQPEQFARARQSLDLISAQWSRALDKLKAFVERT